jgi:hypothetical protein
MTIEGPIIPKKFTPATTAAPTPTVASSVAGEIITCTNTGRMWVNNRDLTMVPVRPEFTFTNLLSETVGGIRSTLFGTFPFQSVGVEIYGSGLRVGAIDATGPITTTGSLSSAGLSVNSASAITVSTTATAGNPINLTSVKPTMSNLSHATGAGLYWFTVTKDLGCEFGDSGGPANSYRLNALISGTKAQFERVVEANDGVKITDLPSSYLLGTDATGLVQSTSLTRGQANLAAPVTLTAGVDTNLGLNALPGSAGTYLITAQVVANHNGNYNLTATLREHGLDVGISTAKTSGNGFVTLTMTAIHTTLQSAPSFRVVCFSGHAAVVQDVVSDSAYPTDDLATHITWVRIA